MAGTFLALYLNAKLKPFSDYHTDFWKMMLVVTPLIGSMFIAGSLVADRVSTALPSIVIIADTYSATLEPSQPRHHSVNTAWYIRRCPRISHTICFALQ